MKRYRWSCPEGKHAGVLAPSRLRVKDIRRYCLECSQEQGVLVERTCAALEKKREAKKDQAERKRKRKQEAQRKKRKAEKEKAAKSIFHPNRRFEPKKKVRLVRGIDVEKHAHRISQASFIQEAFRHLERKPLTVQVRTRNKGDYTTGRAWCDDNRMVLTLPRNCSFGKMAVLVAHELAHLACSHEEVHGPRWREMFLRILNDPETYRFGRSYDSSGEDIMWPENWDTDRPMSYDDAHFHFEVLFDTYEVALVRHWGGYWKETLTTTPVLDTKRDLF